MGTLPKRRIIVVDDDDATRQLVQKQLELAGYEACAYPDGRAALGAISEMGTGIVLADWEMPEMDGLALCRAVRELEALQALGNIYFILLTAHSSKAQVIEGLGAGSNDYLTKPYHPGELLARMEAGQRMLQLQDEVLQRTIEYHKANAQLALLTRKLEELANTDPLTGLANRRCLFERAAQAWQTTEPHGHVLCAIMLDIDKFKRINDTYGHAAGDEVLKNVAETVRRRAPRADLAGRIGGEEFIVVCAGGSLDDAATVAERIRQDIAACPTVCGAGTVEATTSCGVAMRDARMASFDELLARADTMLYAAKQHGRNQTRVLAPDGHSYALSAAATNDSPPGDPGQHVSPVRRTNRANPLESAHADSDHQR